MQTDILTEDIATRGARFVPAEVIEDNGNTVRVIIDETACTARKAMPVAYDAEPGDTLLVAQQGAQAFVIGVLAGQGCTRIGNDGDIELVSRRGSIRLRAGQSIDLVTRKAHLHCLSLEVITDTLVEKASQVSRWVTGLLHTRAARTRTEVSHSAEMMAENISLKAKEKVRVDGERIDLG